MILFAVWQFASLAMLGWAAAALAPIVIHLFTRRQYRRVTWAAMEYLLAAMKKNQRRIHLEQWLLLAIRTLLLLLFALAVADPILSQVGSTVAAGGFAPTHHVFVVDGSYSMDAKHDGPNRFEHAKQAVRKVVTSAPEGDAFSLVLIADPPQTLIRDPAFAKDDLLQELDALPLPDGLGEFATTLGEVESIVSESRRQHPRLVAAEIIFLGDLETNTWEPATSNDAASRLKKLSETTSLTFIDLGTPLANIAVEKLESNEWPVTINRDFTLLATVAAYGGRPGSGQFATLLSDGEAIAQEPINFDPSGKSVVSFRHHFASPGDHTLEVRLPDDALSVDNHRWLSLNVRASLKVLCVYGRANETRYLAAALMPERTANPRVVVDEIPDTSLLDRDLSGYDAVFLANVPVLDASQAELIRRYVNSGGGLIVFLGDLTRPNDFLPESFAAEILPARIEQPSPLGDFKFAPLDYRHELIAPFRGFEKAGLLTTPIWKYFQLQPLKNDEVRTALAFDTGDPAIVERRVGAGRVVLFATAASPASVDRTTDPFTPWTALPTWPSFPPLVQESLSLVTRSRQGIKNRLVGESIGAVVPGSHAESTITVKLPNPGARTASKDSTTRQVRIETTGGERRWQYTDTQVAGVYAAKFGKSDEFAEYFAVNIDPRESPLDRIDPSRLPELLRKQQTTDSPSSSTGGATQRESWYRWILISVVMLLATESYLARRFGGGAS